MKQPVSRREKILTKISNDELLHFNHNNRRGPKGYLGIVHLLMPGFENTPPRVGLGLVETGNVVMVDALVERFVDQSGIGRFVMVVVVVIVAVAV